MYTHVRHVYTSTYTAKKNAHSTSRTHTRAHLRMHIRTNTQARTRSRKKATQKLIRHTCTYTRHPVRYDTTAICLNKIHAKNVYIFFSSNEISRTMIRIDSLHVDIFIFLLFFTLSLSLFSLNIPYSRSSFFVPSPGTDAGCTVFTEYPAARICIYVYA